MESRFVNKKMKPYSWLLLPFAVRRIKSIGVWYIDIPRTSSSSVKVELGKAYSWPYGKKNLLARQHSKLSFFRDHVSAKDMSEIIGQEAWDKLFTFSIVRNPWDRMLSAFFYRIKKGQIPENMSFVEYIKGMRGNGEERMFNHEQLGRGMKNQVDYLVDENNHIIVNDILRFEARWEGLNQIGQKIKVQNFGSLHLQASKPKKHYRQFYCDETSDFVSTYFKRDIETFDFSF